MASKKAGANLTKPLPFGKAVNISSFAFLFAEMISYYRGRVSALSDLEAKCVPARLHYGFKTMAVNITST